MSEKEHIENPVTTWKLAKLYWQSDQKKIAYFYLITLIVLTLFSVALNVGVTYWYKHFWNAIQDYNKSLVFELVLVFIVLATVFVLTSVYIYYVRSKFDVRWREWLTQYVIDTWLKGQSYYYIENFDEYTDNPDQRIQEDVNQFVALTTSLFLGILDAVVTLCSFITLLWVLSGPLTLSLGSLGEIHIPGYLVWIALIYSIAGTYITHKIGKKLISLNFRQQKKEADFRFNAVRIRSNAENIALYQAEDKEKAGIFKSFSKVIDITLQVINREKKLLYFTRGYSQASVIIPLLAALPMYFAKQIQIGGIQQIASAFGQVENSLSFFVANYSGIAQWRAVVLRLTTFMNKMQVVEHKYADVKKLERSEHSGKAVVADGLNIHTQTGHTLFTDLNVRFEPGKDYLIKGPSGVGKSTFIKALAGIWPFVSGVVRLPEGKKVMYLPQRSYFPLGSLREVLLYPGDIEASDDKLYGLLDEVGLPRLKEELDEIKNWSEILSLGEQQKVAFIRVILAAPDWVFLDESTSSLDRDSEKKLYGLLKEKLPNCSIVSVAHRESVADYHDEEVVFKPMSSDGPNPGLV
ncbi:ABC transporter ATP-binding protein/permease [Piscirickettsia litoralis]|uniref:ABC transporter family protein n=1 Tax=Piscirickettsia litoralis TaxID=1891921 RepID=A0ABX3A3U5_9GAMM|nr:ABC transporter ATP-binding protein/permease [Piscirickettsia litoralis]ODN42323.1 ABC transporter family protein [Piscirickettsia litoralis]